MLQAQVPLPEGLFRDVDRSGRVPLYFQISSRVEGAVAQASANESNLLGTKPGGPVLSVTRTSYDTNGKAVEVGHHSYRPELYSFELTLVDKQ